MTNSCQFLVINIMIFSLVRPHRISSQFPSNVSAKSDISGAWYIWHNSKWSPIVYVRHYSKGFGKRGIGKLGMEIWESRKALSQPFPTLEFTFTTYRVMLYEEVSFQIFSQWVTTPNNPSNLSISFAQTPTMSICMCSGKKVKFTFL